LPAHQTPEVQDPIETVLLQTSPLITYAYGINPPFFDFEEKKEKKKKDIHLLSFSLEKTQAYLHGNWTG